MKISSKLVGAGLAAFGAMSVCAMSTTASAGSVTQPGELVGYSWAPLPEGIFFATTGSYGNSRGFGYKSELGVNIPVIIWSTPWTIFGAHVEAYAAVPSVALGIRNGIGTSTYIGALYNPYANAGLAWNLGNGFGLSTFVGGYAPVNNALGQDNWTFNWRTGLTWAGDGWTLSAHTVLGIAGNNLNTGTGAPGAFFGPGAFGTRANPNYVNLDLTATKTLGKWSFGPVAFGSWDIGSCTGGALCSGAVNGFGFFQSTKQSQFAVGGLVGYDFGPVILQTYLTHDVAVSNYLTGVAPFAHETYETRFWMRAIVPLWVAPAPAPVVAKY
jgi:hypothetical protein